MPFITYRIMGRTIITFILLVILARTANTQCPDLPTNTTANGSSNTTIELCGAGSVLFEVNDPNLLNGNIDWYSSTTSGFDPLISGTLIGSSTINSASPCDPGGCPELESIYINACGPAPDEERNEFVVVSSGAGFLVDDFSFMFDPVNTFGAPNQNINTGNGCGWIPGDASLFTGCANVIPVGPGSYITPNSIVIVQASNLGSVTYDISSLCGLSECIYVLSNSCDRSTPAFKNYDSSNSSTRTNSIALSCGCADAITYTVDDANFGANQGDGAYVLGDGTTFGNNGCNIGPTINSINTFSLNATTDPYTHNFTDTECNTTQYVVGVYNSTLSNGDCCTDQMTNEYAIEISCVTAEIQGNADLCPGECEEITVSINGGTSPYELDLSITGLPFPFDNISLPFPGFPIDEKITICFDNGGPLVDDATFTVDIPAIASGFSGTLVLNGIVDADGCSGTVSGAGIGITLNPEPDITHPGDQEACDLGNGTGIFVLTDMDNTINGGSGAMVNYYSDPDGMTPINSPYITGGGPIYAQVIGNPCNSEIIEIQLNVISNGDAGLITFFCTDPINGPSTECLYCDDDGVLGEDVSLTILFENPGINYDYEVMWTADSGASSTISGTSMISATVTLNITETTTFEIIVVTAEGGCPDMTDLGDAVTIQYSLEPDIDVPQDLSGCGMVTLPDITGNSVPSNASYYSEPGATGTQYSPGDVITTSMTLYLQAGVEGCEVEYSFEVSIEGEAMIDDPEDVVTCGTYILPEITGTNVANASYYTEIDGGGNEVSSGTTISTSITLYLFDPVCGGNQPTLNITISPGPIIENNTDTLVCEMYIVEPIIGMDLSGNEMYYESSGGMGAIIDVGDTLTTDSLIYIYDNTAGCEVEVPVFVDIVEQGFPGLDTAIVLCQGDVTLININESLGGDTPDTTGLWMDVDDTGVIVDSTAVNFSSLTEGSYIFEYHILDSICIDTHAILTVNIVGSPNAGSDAMLSICTDTTGVDVISLLTGADTGGVFYDEMGMVATFDPENASFEAASMGTTLYNYVVGNPASSCGADTSIFTLVVEDNINAGDDVNTSICAGVLLDLTTLLQNNTAIGVFEDPSMSGGLMGTNFDTDAVADGQYIIRHILAGNGSCSPDTAFLTINITDGQNAGDEMEIPLCGDTFISLDDFVDGDPGGSFYFNDNLLPSGDITYSNETGTFEYLYIVGDGIECPFDTAVFTVIRNIRPPSFLDISNTSLCSDDCTTISLGAANSGGQTIILYYHIESDLGESDSREFTVGDLMPTIDITLCVGNGGLENNELQVDAEYSLVIDSVFIDNPDCIYLDMSRVTFNTYSDGESTLTGTRCLDEEVMVGNDVYDKDMPSGTTTIENGSFTGCDSIIIVDLVFQDVAEGEYIDNPCIGDTVIVLGNEYTQTNITDEILLPNGSANGCDSLVKINIVFTETTFGTYEETSCLDTFEIHGVQFYEGNEMNSILLENQNAQGCDSIVDVTITFESPVVYELNQDVCSAYSIEINGTTYDINNPSGIEPFNNMASNGCDSIVEINLTFNQMPVDSMLNIATCDENYSLTIGSETFDINQPSGMVNLVSDDPAFCDTILNVNLTFGELGVDYLEIDGGCTESDSGKVVIEDIAGVAPFNLIYNGNNTIAFVLPVEIDLPVGTGQISITDDVGCEAILDYELFPGGGQNFEVSNTNGQLNITGGGVDSIAWTPSGGLSCTDCLDPIASPTSTTSYTAEIFFDDSCSTELMIDITVIDDIPDYLFPSVFSPNGDNINDNFALVITEGAIGIPQQLLIYDRWGNRIYTGLGQDIVTIGWDGTINNQDVTPGVYVYQLTVLEEDRPVIIYGDVTVVR